MLADDSMIHDDPAASPAAREEGIVTVTVPDPARQGAIDVITLRGLVRALKALRNGSTSSDEFDHALSRMINLNGAMARVVQDGGRRGE